MTVSARIVSKLDLVTSANPHRIYVHTEDAGVATAPDAVPTITVGYVQDGSPPTWVEDVSAANMLNAVDDTATVNGALYYYDVTSVTGRQYSIRVEATISGSATDDHAVVEADLAAPNHTHDGIDAPRVSWLDLTDVPEDVTGTTESELVVTIVDDVTSQQTHGLREAAVLEPGTEETLAPIRAATLLSEHKGLEETLSFEAALPTAPVKGQLIQITDRGVTVRITNVVELGPGSYLIEAGHYGGDVEDEERRRKQRLRTLERYQ